MILLGIDDTDVEDAPGTNQHARALARVLGGCSRIVRHQLLFDPRIPYTKHNSSASLWFPEGDPDALFSTTCALLPRLCPPGSDPGVAITISAPQGVREFARRCKREVVTQEEARATAAAHRIALRGLGGTEGGVIGALAAIGLAAGADDGRVVQIGEIPDDCAAVVDASEIFARGVETIVSLETGERIRQGNVAVGKHLRPNVRQGRVVLFVKRAHTGLYEAQRLD